MVARATYQSVDDYIAHQPEAARNALKRVRNAVRKALPQAQEVISYNMPTYKVHDATVLHFAGWKGHYSLYAATKAVCAEFKDDLAKYQIDKGTIRFPLSQTVPEKLIERIAKFCAKELAG